ncbi:MAG: hypothetical protein M3024_16290 [Candidatus Dormibacteraeota bacterium]|nr:hypothetical protein [Candidatus Dormibacteraeota bacterium]
MSWLLEEDPDEPDGDQPAPAPALVPTVAAGGGEREQDFRSENLSTAELTDGATLAARLGAASKDGWRLVGVYPAGEIHVVVLSKPKKGERESRPVGFFPTAR